MISRYCNQPFAEIDPLIEQKLQKCLNPLTPDELTSMLHDLAVAHLLRISYINSIVEQIAHFTEKVTELLHKKINKLLPTRWWGVLEVIFAHLGWISFQLHEEVGSGAYGHVYRCSIGGRPYAAKTFLTHSHELPAKIQLKTRVNSIENILATLLQHEHLLPGFGTLTYKEHEYHIYLLAGESLHDRIKQTPLDRDAIALFLRQLIHALRYMQRQQLFHLDVKASNCLIHQGRLLLGDFGATAGHLMEPKGFFSSPLYASPRLLVTHSPNPSCDVWGFFMVFLELVEAPLLPTHLSSLLRLLIQWEDKTQYEIFLSYREQVLTAAEKFGPLLTNLMRSFFQPESLRPSLRELSQLLKGESLPAKAFKEQPLLLSALRLNLSPLEEETKIA